MTRISDVYEDVYTDTYGTTVWGHSDAIAEALSKDDLRPDLRSVYDEVLAGKSIASTIKSAIAHLVEEGGQ